MAETGISQVRWARTSIRDSNKKNTIGYSRSECNCSVWFCVLMAAELPFSFTWWKVWFVRKILKRCSFFVVASYAAHNTEVDNDDDNYDDNFFLNTNRPQRDVLKEWQACICIWWATKNRQRIRKVSERLAVNKLAGSSKWIDTYVVYIKIVESVIVVAAERDQCVAWLFDFCFLFFSDYHYYDS